MSRVFTCGDDKMHMTILSNNFNNMFKHVYNQTMSTLDKY